MKKLKIAGITLLAFGALCFINSCSVKVPDNISVVKDFDINVYAGQWYEIARFDFKYEKDLKNVTANYALNKDGSIEVINKGYNYVKNEWEESKGKAKFNGSEKEGALKVSFFGPFYGGIMS